ncbi:hypothetical protein EDB87DRAFT_1292626 [Lactarius vividus]|nr:hypothetical protein EDB87DRAFT_1292626 [Lactarius vividus]
MYRQIYTEKSNAPLLVNSCEVDPPFPKELAETTDEKFAKFEPGYKRTYWEGIPCHGFAVRGDLTDPAVAAAKDGSFKATVEWFINYMQSSMARPETRRARTIWFASTQGALSR